MYHRQCKKVMCIATNDDKEDSNIKLPPCRFIKVLHISRKTLTNNFVNKIYSLQISLQVGTQFKKLL
jgi:hypothetical protein